MQDALDEIVSSQLGTLGTILSFGDIFWGVVQFTKEIVYHRNRYKNIRQIAEITFSGCFWTASVLVIQLCTHIYTGNFANLCDLAWKCCLFAPLYCLLLWHKRKSLFPSRGLDCGTSSANSYFYGYLNIILPNKGDGNKGLRERIEDFEDSEHVQIPVKKLFILLPKELYASPLLSDRSENIHKIKNLEFVLRDRAGSAMRQYTNTVYKILPKRYYVLAEFATPLLTMYETIKNGDLSSFSSEVFDKFYHRLQYLLNSPSCRDLCILIPYSERTSSGKLTDVAQLLCDAIEQQLK